MKVKRIVNVDMVYIVHCVKVFGECQRHVLLFQDKLYNSDVLKSVMRKVMSTLSTQYQFMDGICRQ